MLCLTGSYGGIDSLLFKEIVFHFRASVPTSATEDARMQQHNGWLIEELGHPASVDPDDIHDCLIAISPEEGQRGPLSPLMPLEPAEEGPAPFPVRKTLKKDLALGTGGALLAHALFATTLLLALIKPLPPCQKPFISVYFVGGEHTGQSSGDSENSASTHNSERVDELASSVTRKSKTSQEDPKSGERKDLALAMPTPHTRKPINRSEKRNQSQPKSQKSVAVSRESTSAPKEIVQQDTGSTTGEGHGNKASGNETGEGAQFSTVGNSSPKGIGGEFDAAAVDQPPRIVKKVRPVYPNRARILEIPGKVVVRFLVEPDGCVSKPSIVEAHPAGYFEQSTLDAVRQWKFKPGSIRGHFVATWVTLPVQFRLTGQD